MNPMISRRACCLLAIPALMTGTVNAQDNQTTEKREAAGLRMVKVVMETSKGVIELELNGEKAPATVENFVKYVKAGHYDGTVFHRVIPTFMIQGGGFSPEMQEKPTGGGIFNEGKNGLKNVRGSIAMARRGDPNSATAQFFINVQDNPGLDYPNPDGHGYAVFGKVTKGLEVVDAIKVVPTGNVGPYQNVPLEPVVIKSVKLAE